jgi:Tfp pilus assembly protein PilO
MEYYYSITFFKIPGGKMNAQINIVIIISITIVIVVGLWQGMSAAKAQIGANQKTQYEKLAEQTADAQQKTAEVLEDIRTRLAAIEKLLSEVQ